MKKQIKNIVYLLLVAATVACDKSEGVTAPTLESLKEVVFEEITPKVVKSEPTGHVVINPTTGKPQKEYIEVIEKQYVVSPLSVVAETNDVIFPGSMLRGDYFLKGEYTPLVLKNEFEPVTLSISLRGDIQTSEKTKPVLSEVRSVLNDLVTRQKHEIDYAFVPTVFSYESNKISTSESFKRSLKIHAKANVLAGLVKASFDFEESQGSTNTKNYVMVAFRQTMYNASIDPKHYSTWIKGDIDTSELGAYEPVYISSVDYGRVGYILVETDKSEEHVRKMIQASLEVAVQYINFQSNAHYVNEFKSLFANDKVKVKIFGGPTELGNKVNSYDNFVTFVQMPNADNLVKSSMPISYKVRRLKDNSEVKVLDTFTERVINLKDN